ncbi:MAG: flotillin family protein, partial [Limisphaerales bacterium]
MQTPIPILLAEMTSVSLFVGAIAVILLIVFMFLAIWASRYTKVGPNQVLVISGRKRHMTDPDGTPHDVGFRIVKGGG